MARAVGQVTRLSIFRRLWEIMNQEEPLGPLDGFIYRRVVREWDMRRRPAGIVDFIRSAMVLHVTFDETKNMGW